MILQVYLIDQGIQRDVEFGEFYEYPSELLEFGVFNCFCPVRVPAMQDLSIYNDFNGCKCKCDAGNCRQEQQKSRGLRNNESTILFCCAELCYSSYF